jgi:hypothetical protein
MFSTAKRRDGFLRINIASNHVNKPNIELSEEIIPF